MMDDDIDNTLPANSNLICGVCGEREFEEREGFYYCLECGTKQEQVRLVEVEREDDFDNEKRKAKKQKIHVAKAEKPQLTSWECYNYILRGFVEELLSFGAKEDLKLMTLQIWAAYLRRMEIAFFNRKQPDLPKLGIKYLPNDAKTIYNHSWEKHKKRKRKRTDDASGTSGGETTSAKTWRKNKRKLDESNYSLTSATSGGSGLTSSTSAYSNRAIKLGFNIKARKFYKKKMPVKHLEKHAGDAEGLLKCHKQPYAREIKRSDYVMMVMNIRQIFCILGIALNLIEDEIQLSDLMRFIQEGHLDTNNVLQYFPENIASNGKEMLTKINFHKCPDKYTDKGIRDHIGIICKNIGIFKLKNPDIIKLARRYITELCLPSEIGDYIERLINLVPPRFETRAPGVYAGFEARAMAYIIFVLKLLYGLDGNKEYRMSEAASKLNQKIDKLNSKSGEKQSHLFVWNEWVQYIEMRKIIISQYNTSFCEQFKQTQSVAQLLEQMTEDMRLNEEREALLNETADKPRQRLKTLKQLFERFQENFKHSDDNEKKPTPLINFKPSFTPALSYFKNITLLCDSENNGNSNTDIHIPDFMRIDHSQRDIKSYLETKPLIEYFKKHNKELKVHVLSSNKSRTFLGIFRPPRSLFRGATVTRVFKASSDITDEEWTEIVANEVVYNTDDLEFKTDLDQYHDRYYYARLKQEAKKTEIFNPFMNYDLTMIRDNDDQNDDNNGPTNELPTTNTNFCKSHHNLSENDLQSMHSFDLFSENNMEPIQNGDLIKQPRRNLEKIDLFEGISDEESVLNDDDMDTQTSCSVNENESISSSQEIGLRTQGSRTQSPDVFEEFIEIENPENPNNPAVKIKKEKLDDNDKQNRKLNENTTTAANRALKVYISNMDCWMLLGNILMLTKAQRSQLQDKFPRSFNWLLETCAQTINVDWSAVYEQLLCIETMFCLGIENLETLKDCVYIKSKNPIKDLQTLITAYREIW